MSNPDVSEELKREFSRIYYRNGMGLVAAYVALEAIAPRLKAEGLREGLTRALEISRKHEQALDVEVDIFNEIAHADALSPQAKETK